MEGRFLISERDSILELAKRSNQVHRSRGEKAARSPEQRESKKKENFAIMGANLVKKKRALENKGSASFRGRREKVEPLSEGKETVSLREKTVLRRWWGGKRMI